MDKYNLIILGLIVAAIFLALWWAFNTIRRIELQKNFCAIPLSNIAKLWRRAKFVPEDAKERESLYLYRDFLRKFDESECQYPIIVKDGGVRCMTRREYDHFCGQKNILPVSFLLTLVSLIIAVGAILVNVFVTKTLWMGIALSAIMPILQIGLAIFIGRFNKDKNSYRDGIFMALKENSVAFLRITKPFIIVDAYPHRFGKGRKPLYATMGTIPEKQVIKTRDFIIRQKEAEAKIVMANVNNEEEIQEIMEKTTRKPRKTATVTKAVEPINDTFIDDDDDDDDDDENEATTITANPRPKPVQPTISTPTQAPTDEPEPTELTEQEQDAIIDNIVESIMTNNTEQEQVHAPVEQQPTVEVTPVETPVEPEPTEIETPAEDDFSLDAIGQALDAEIAKRNKKR